jgi:hypothetical protein
MTIWRPGTREESRAQAEARWYGDWGEASTTRPASSMAQTPWPFPECGVSPTHPYPSPIVRTTS